MQCDDPCKSYANFYCNLRNAFHTSFRIQKKLKISYSWITQGISESLFIKNKLAKKFLKHPAKQSEIKFKKYNNPQNHVVKIVNKNYPESQFLRYRKVCKYTTGIFLEISKAFDTVNHKILIKNESIMG